MTSQWPDHLLGLDEYFDLPEDNSRHYELAEGILQVIPRPAYKHQRIARLLTQELAQQ
ncbi:MAG TPA: Uma2 family endonuclease, partial [Pseudonocardiaceae bacterium]|nr:Uma2 family endonuclease [Pseudonocardiaceae bacterium]